MCILSKNVILINLFKRISTKENLGLCRVTDDVVDVLAAWVLNAVFSDVYYIHVIWLFCWKPIFSLFGAGFWSLVGARLCSVSVPYFCSITVGLCPTLYC